MLDLNCLQQLVDLWVQMGAAATCSTGQLLCTSHGTAACRQPVLCTERCDVQLHNTRMALTSMLGPARSTHCWVDSC
jgi:hypothetical protein